YKSVKLISTVRAAQISALATVTLGWFWGWHGMTFNLQSYLLPVLNLVIYYTLHACIFSSRRSSLIASLFFGFLLIADQRMLVFSPLLLIPVWQNTCLREAGTICSLVLAYLLIPFLGLILLWHFDALGSFFEHTIRYPLQFRNCKNPYMMEMIKNLLSWGVASERAPIGIASLGLILTLMYDNRIWLKMFIIFGLLGALSYAVLGGRDYANYLLLFAPFTLILIALAEQFIRSHFSVFTIPFNVFLYFLIVQTGSVSAIYYFKTGHILYPFDKRAISDTVKFIKENRKSNEDILVWGYAPSIYNLTETLSPFKDVGLLSVTGANFFSQESSQQCYLPQLSDEFRQLLQENAPKFFIRFEILGRKCEEFSTLCPPPNTDFSRTFPLINFDYDKVSHLNFIKDIIDQNYTLTATYDYSLEKVRIYVKN
ncbi:MAG: hypothetical protein SGJ02_08470, partial [bacterium]|nr:hypothetical protein [bacterium]